MNNQRSKIQKGIAVMLSVVLLCGCSLDEAPSDSYGNVWIDSDINGYVKEDKEYRTQDDFAAAVNRDWIAKNGDDTSAFVQMQDKVYDKKRAVLNDKSLKGKYALELKKYAALAEDWDGRKEDGVEPLRKYLETIRNIETMDDLYDYICDPEQNPLGIAPIMPDLTVRLKKDPDLQVLALKGLEFSLGDAEQYYNLTSDGLEKKEIFEEETTYLLKKLGYTDKEIDSVIRGTFRAEKMLSGLDYVMDEDGLEDSRCNRKELAKLSGSYPLIRFLEAWGYEGNDAFTGSRRLIEKTGGIVSRIGVSDMKALLISNYLRALSSYLDRETYDRFQDIEKSRTTEEEEKPEEEEREEDALLFDTYIGNGMMVGPMNRCYVEKYIEGTVRKDIEEITQGIIDEYEDIFMGEEWMSEKGRKACVDKLKSITIHPAVPNNEDVDLSDLTLLTRQEGGSFADAEVECRSELNRIRAKQSQRKYDPSYWDPFMPMISTTIINAMYNAQTNGIYIFAGILEKPAYDPDYTLEQKLGGIGVIIGHEITHGFDKNGSTYDKNGIENTFLGESDRMAFEDKSDKVADTYSNIYPFPSSGACNGTNVNAEATADMGGLAVTLAMAEEQKDFDYDRYFRSMAGVWATQNSKETEKWYKSYDEHPLAFLRVNVGLQQFDEFNETYGVKPGDGMYVEPKNRICVW